MNKDNTRIAKNTILLYVRMMLIMVVTLYTSRVVLYVLGAEDFGIYNVVGGVIAMFSIISSSLSSAISRFFTYELGLRNKERIEIVFSSSLYIQILLIIIIFILAEFIGVWFLNTHMNIPVERLSAANWVLQCTILSFCAGLLQAPYNAAIIAHERMDAFAYFGIVEVITKLCIAISLLYVNYDLLIIYSILYLILHLILCSSYIYFGVKKLEGCRVLPHYHKTTFKSLLSYSSWTIFGSISYAGYNYGYNIILNIYFGTIVNAARGIAVQVQNAIISFSNNLQASINPQIIKNYANGNFERMHDLIYASSKYSFFLLYILSLPLILKTEFVLSVWLINVPPHTANFVKLMLITILIDCLSGPMICSNQATGNVKWFQILTNTLIILSLPVSFYILTLIDYPEVIYIVYFVFTILALLVRWVVVMPSINMSFCTYFKKVLFKILIVVLFSIPIPIGISYLLNNNIIGMVIISFVTAFNILLAVYLFGLVKTERILINNILFKLINKKLI